jgi:Sulfotransferase domain
MLPDFIIVGAQKAGTTSLYHLLRQHAGLRPSFEKEVHFFDGGLDPRVDAYEKGPDWYRAHFPRTSRSSPGHRSFEASPLYLFHPLAPGRISELVPDAKIIVLLRNPVDRALSHHAHSTRLGVESLPVDEALRAEDARLQPALRSENYKDASFINHSYQRRGMYADQLGRYGEHFAREQMLVIECGDLFRNTRRVLERIFAFVGVDAGAGRIDLRARNVGGVAVPVGEDVRRRLIEHFEPHNRELYDLVGEDYGWDAPRHS